MEEEQDAGVAQLREVFDACDTERTGRLDAAGLRRLCRRLQLAHRAPALVHYLLGGRRSLADAGGGQEGPATVSFEEFKEGFISILMEAEDETAPSDQPPSGNVAAIEATGESQEAIAAKKDREVSPKYVLGEKKYGRRSRPASQADVDVEISSDEDFSADEVLGPAAADSAGGTAAPKVDPRPNTESYPESGFEDSPGKFSSSEFVSSSPMCIEEKDGAEEGGVRGLASEGGSLMPPVLFAAGFEIGSSPMFGQSFTMSAGIRVGRVEFDAPGD
ncbi:hypothetical protein HPB48_007150 [Haemaphysalis longicornis]|uniref:EF-hand domain-containing protein n=1 Tax=Haemaphysalis longicornis TaxID=44386 RepID=A0A9J6GNP2_HAELO|nr:hypothetical protein HPB48_007150 [Haemaphysalis longicornis]